MRKPIQKIVALCCVGAMALCFASCKPDTPETESNSLPPTTEATDAPTEAPDVTDAPTEAPVAPPAGGIAKPANSADGVKLYNDALAKAGTVTATVTRNLSKVEAKAMITIDVLKDVPGVNEAFALNNANLDGAKLSNLDAGSVASMSATESGDNYVIEFTLKEVNAGADAANGLGGYMYLLDYNTVNETVGSIGRSLGGENFVLEVKELQSITMRGGKFTVTINKTTGAMSAATLSFEEEITAKVKTSALPGVSATANVVGGGTVNYTVA